MQFYSCHHHSTLTGSEVNLSNRDTHRYKNIHFCWISKGHLIKVMQCWWCNEGEQDFPFTFFPFYPNSWFINAALASYRPSPRLSTLASRAAIFSSDVIRRPAVFCVLWTHSQGLPCACTVWQRLTWRLLVSITSLVTHSSGYNGTFQTRVGKQCTESYYEQCVNVICTFKPGDSRIQKQAALEGQVWKII